MAVMMNPEMRHLVIFRKFTDILEEQDPSVFRIEAREWSQLIPPQHL